MAGGFCGETASRNSTTGCRMRNPSRRSRTNLVGIKGPLNHARLSKAPLLNVALRQCSTLRLPAPGALVQRRSSPVSTVERGHGHLRGTTRTFTRGIEYAGRTPERRRCSIFIDKEFPTEFKRFALERKRPAAQCCNNCKRPRLSARVRPVVRWHRNQAGQLIWEPSADLRPPSQFAIANKLKGQRFAPGQTS